MYTSSISGRGGVYIQYALLDGNAFVVRFPFFQDFLLDLLVQQTNSTTKQNYLLIGIILVALSMMAGTY